MKKKSGAAKTLRHIAIWKGSANRQLKRSIILGTCGQDPKVQIWQEKIPCKGSVPTPEELIAYLAARIETGTDPFL